MFATALPSSAIAKVQNVSVHAAKVKATRGIQAEAARQDVHLV
jgi:hypothetical protein